MGAAPRQSLKESRERELVAATRALFDERGMQDAPVDEIARSVGIARGLIYRQFSSKEELFVLTVTDYLAELAGRLEAADRSADAPRERFLAVTDAYLGFCSEYPAFLDCSLGLMRRRSDRLQDDISESVWLRLGTGMASCIGPFARVLEDGVASGDFTIAEPEKVANVLWTQVLGAMHLARIQVGLRQDDAGRPDLFLLTEAELREMLVDAALAQIGAAPR